MMWIMTLGWHKRELLRVKHLARERGVRAQAKDEVEGGRFPLPHARVMKHLAAVYHCWFQGGAC